MLATILIICGFILGVLIVVTIIDQKMVEKKTAILTAEKIRQEKEQAKECKKRQHEMLLKDYDPQV